MPVCGRWQSIPCLPQSALVHMSLRAHTHILSPSDTALMHPLQATQLYYSLSQTGHNHLFPMLQYCHLLFACNINLLLVLLSYATSILLVPPIMLPWCFPFLLHPTYILLAKFPPQPASPRGRLAYIHQIPQPSRRVLGVYMPISIKYYNTAGEFWELWAMPGATAITAGEFWRSTCLYPLNPTIQPASLQRAVSYACGNRYHSRRVLGEVLAMPVEIAITAGES